jgi:TonB family protein
VTLAAAAAACVLLPLAGLSYSSQTPTGRLSGAVHDASGAAVPQAAVVVVYPETGHREVASTTDSGEFAFQGLPAGVVRVEVRKPGFAVFERKEVRVDPAVPQQLDAMLEVGRVSESIEVVAKAPPRPAATPLKPPRRVRVGGNVQATRLIDSVKPEYPEEARSRGIEGTVQLQAVISTSGGLLGLQPVNTLVDPALTKAAIEAVRQWRYEPTLLNGEPVEVVTTITVNFRLSP